MDPVDGRLHSAAASSPINNSPLHSSTSSSYGTQGRGEQEGGGGGEKKSEPHTPEASSSFSFTHRLISDNSLAAEEEEHDVVAVSQDARQPRPTFPGPAEPSRTTGILVTSGMLENIRRYKAAYDTYLRDVSHEAVGSFDPWAVADR